MTPSRIFGSGTFSLAATASFIASRAFASIAGTAATSLARSSGSFT